MIALSMTRSWRATAMSAVFGALPAARIRSRDGFGAGTLREALSAAM